MAFNPPQKSTTSKRDLDAYKYKKDLRDWLRMHGNPVGQKYQDEYDCTQAYKKFVQSLKTDRKPLDTAALILSTEHLPADVLLPVSRVGKVVKKRLESEISQQPDLNLLSPAVVLAQKRRKEVLSHMENGTWPLDYAPTPISVQEEYPVEEMKKTSTFLPSDLSVNKSPTKFEPKWDNYDTMKSRWKYIRPQTRQLVPEYTAPTTATSYVKMYGTQLYGHQVDLDYYQSQLMSQSNRTSRILEKSSTFES